MRGRWVFRVLKFLLLAIVFVALLSAVVMGLWNWVMPALFGFHRVSYLQAAALLVLGKILFGGFRGRRGPSMHWKGRMMERWAQMTPEDRAKFREGMKGRCGMFGARTEE